MYNTGGMPFGGFPQMMNLGAGMPGTPTPITAFHPKQRSCRDDGNAKITAELDTSFLEELNKLSSCKQLAAEINGKKYNFRLLCPKDKKHKRKSHSSSSSSSSRDRKKKRRGKKSGIEPCIKFCDCNIPVPPGFCEQLEAEKRATEKEDRINKSLSLCMQMMREMFVRNFDRQEAEHDQAVQMLEIPVMVVPPGGMPGGMQGMGMSGGMPGLGMMGGGGMPGMGMMGGGMPGMGMMGGGAMPGMGMMGGGMPGMGMTPPGIGPGSWCPMGMPSSEICSPCSQKRISCDRSKEKEKQVICKTNRDQQCDESALAPKNDSKGVKKNNKGGKKGKGKNKGKKGGKKGKGKKK